MKQAIGGAAAVVTIAWLLFVFTTTENCDRIKRGAAPVRVTMDFARWATTNWLSVEARIDLLRWSLKADEATQRFLSNQFYGKQACAAPSAAPAAALPAAAASAPAAHKEAAPQ